MTAASERDLKITGMRAGIVGAGLMGRWHAHAVKRLGGRIVAILDTDIKAATRLSQRHRQARVFSSIVEMLESCSIEVLHICSPLSSHSELASIALAAGINVLVEKPMTPTADEAERILVEARRSKLLVCPVHQFLFQNGVRKAIDLLPSIGEVVRLEMLINTAGAEGRPEQLQNEIIADILPHPLSLFEALLPNGVENVAWTTMYARPGELGVGGQSSHVSLAMHLSLLGRPTRCMFTIVGTSSSIELNLFHGYSVVRAGSLSRLSKISAPLRESSRGFVSATHNLGRRLFEWEPAYPGLRQLISQFYRAIRNEDQAPLSEHHILATAIERERLIAQSGLFLE
ncbi:MAG: hypothetical protein BMS9Abin05_2412 [Rhodothermia bacterium]|nr:MAG: hypothetical protein BMS9Abin05_2412 [Rhodothermia bacterium]